MNQEMYFEHPQAQRSPQRHPSLSVHRQPSRQQFEPYGTMPAHALYSDEQQQQPVQHANYMTGRLNSATINASFNAYDPWTYNAQQASNSMAALSMTSRMKGMGGRGRPGLPQNWMGAPAGDLGFHGMAAGAMGHHQLRGSDMLREDPDDELILTAIVIKNIPFAVKKEQLVQLMTDMGLPLPYAFNYHFDNGIFRGLAFANFTTAEETAVVIDALNHYDLCGRKLRVEYKKMLPLAERERIEREKRERRGQLQEQHQPVAPAPLTSQPSLSSISSNIPTTSPSPLSARNQKPAYDLNDPQILDYYNQLLLFKTDLTRDSFTYSASLSPQDRRVVHTLAHQLGLAHVSKGAGEQRAVHIFRVHDVPNISPPIPQMPTSHPSDNRRALNRAATTDFTDVRGDGFYNTLGRQSSGLLGFPESPVGLTAPHNLRGAKSYADLRSYTPSPVPSTASFPATLSNNFARFADYAQTTTAVSNPNLSATAASMSNRDELLVNGMTSLAIGGGFGQNGSPRSVRNPWDREAPGPIGGHRAFSSAVLEEPGRDRIPSRQPRGPLPERGTGFAVRQRQNGHNGRGSDDLSSPSNLEVTAE